MPRETHDGPRPDNRETENEMIKPGSPPRPATEPVNTSSSTKNSKTATDPSTGEPQHRR